MGDKTPIKTYGLQNTLHPNYAAAEQVCNMSALPEDEEKEAVLNKPCPQGCSCSVLVVR